jgi:hypothetical protein
MKVSSTALKPIPEFKNEEEEREFWQRHCLTEYLDLEKPVRVFLPNLHRSQKPDPSSVN